MSNSNERVPMSEKDIERQISETRTVVCSQETAMKLRAIGNQTRADEPPESPEVIR